VVIEGVPAGLRIDLDAMRRALARRRPGQSGITTARHEDDEPVFLSGVRDGIAIGTAVTIYIANKDVDSRPYEGVRNLPRPGHADLTAWFKWGQARDHRGGGPFSARTTAPLVAAGAVARQLMPTIRIAAHAVEIGNVRLAREVTIDEIVGAERYATRCADAGAAERMEAAIRQARSDRDSVGGVVECRAEGAPPGVGGPGFGGLESELARGLFGIPAVRGVEFGAGFAAARMRGSAHNDPIAVDEGGRIITRTNHSGGILGGISTAMPIIVRAAFKPVPSIPRLQQTVDLSTGEAAEILVRGRHDPCVVPRAVPIVEAVVACVLVDQLMIALRGEPAALAQELNGPRGTCPVPGWRAQRVQNGP
jgi:chorismate synthase